MSTSLSPLLIPRKKPTLLGFTPTIVDEVSVRVETVRELVVSIAVTDNVSPVMETVDELPINMVRG